MVKRCSYVHCKSDSRYAEKQEHLRFWPFPKPKTNLEKCRRWARACGGRRGPHGRVDINSITRHSFVCSKHFKDGSGPTLQYPDPIPADGSAVFKARKPRKPRGERGHSHSASTAKVVCGATHPGCKNSNLPSCTSTQTEEIMYSSLDMLAAEAKLKELEDDKEKLTEQLKGYKEENLQLKKQLESCEQKLLTATLPSQSLDPERVESCDIKNLFVYYTGLTYIMFMALFEFLVPDPINNPVQYSEKRHDIDKFSLKHQLFLVLCRLRNGFHLKDIAFRTSVSQQTIGTIFSSWVKYMYAKLGYLSFWPHRDVLISQMTSKYRKQFSNSLAIIDGTELRIERPSSLKSQSQCYSDYKSTNTLKALVVVDSRGSVMFLSELFSGSISDNRICEDCGFYDLLSVYKNKGLIIEGDAIMADKGFQIEEPLHKLGLKFNVPPNASSTSQMRPGDVATTRQIASHRIHVERAINQIKRFQIVGRKIPVSLLHQINEIWYVCGMLTNFQDTLVKS